MVHLNEHFPGMEELIVENGLSIQAQVNHPLMTATDQRGEQTINRDAKTLGSVYDYHASLFNVKGYLFSKVNLIM